MPGYYVAHTNREWFDHLSRLGHGLPRRVDEVNFWSPSATRSMKGFHLGEPVFFRLGAPDRAIGGYGFFADFHLLDVHLAWDLFGPKNGAGSLSELARLLGRQTPASLWERLACTVLRDAVFWPDWRWIPWGVERGYARTGAQRGRTEHDPANVRALEEAMAADAVAPPADLVPEFVPLEADERRIEEARRAAREGQGTFRLRLLAAYDGRCAVTGEHTEPVLQAAHIQPYLGPASNHVRNGLLLTQEFHTLFDRGLATVETRHDRYELRVSPQIRERWQNGHRYYEFDRRELHVPADPSLRPSPLALEWHREHVFEQGMR